MNDTKIEWATKTWNPVTGCNRGCSYCYARGIARRFGGQIGGHSIKKHMPHDLPQQLAVIRKSRKIVKAPFPFGFEPTIHRYRLDEPLQEKKTQNIFVCSMGDLFGPWVPDEWINAVFDACKRAPWHRYLFLTKYPDRYAELARRDELPDDCNFWYGTTIEGMNGKSFISEKHNCFVSMEPILYGPKAGADAWAFTNWIIMGAMTGPGREKYKPKRRWIEIILEDAESIYIPVFMKDSLIPIVGEENMKRDFPWEKQEGSQI